MLICWLVAPEVGLPQSDGSGELPGKSLFELTREKAEQGDAVSQDELGVMYATGNGVRRDVFEASRWLRKAAEQGLLSAQYHLPLYFYDGARTDYRQAIAWYRKAAEQGHAPAQNRLGRMYAMGLGVSEDLDEAIKWFQKAAKQGHADAKANLARYGDRNGGLPRARPHNWQKQENAQRETPQRNSKVRTERIPLPESTNAITTLDGQRYEATRILRVRHDGLEIEYRPDGGGVGMAKIKFQRLPEDLQARFGFDPQQAATYEAQRVQEQAVLQKHLWTEHREATQRLAARLAKEEAEARAEAERRRIAQQKAEAERREQQRLEAEARHRKELMAEERRQTELLERAERVRLNNPANNEWHANPYNPYSSYWDRW